MTNTEPILCDCSDDAPSSLWWRIGGAAFLAMNAMVLGIAVNGSDPNDQERWALELSIFFVGAAVATLLGKEFLESTWQMLKERRLGIEALFLIGILACFGASVLSLTQGVGGTYADVAGMLLVIYSLGKQIGSYGKARVLRSLGDWAPEKRVARLVAANGAEPQAVPASQIKQGDRLLLLPGEPVPVDVRIVQGTASFQQASLTGEAFAVAKTLGDTLAAGVYATDASVEAIALRDGAESSIDEIRALVLSGLASPGKEQALALRVLRWFVPAVLALSVLTFLFHASRGPWPEATFHAMSVMVIACPCALGFATPLAVWTAIARLREIGVLARSGDAVERLAEVDTVVFDKTGTLTQSSACTLELVLEPAWRDREAQLLHWLAAAESYSNHPLAQTLEPLWRPHVSASLPRPFSFALLPGQGIEATFPGGVRFFVGAANAEGRDLALRVNGETAAYIRREETISAGALPAIHELEAAQLRVILATGDSAERAAALPIGERHARLTPVEKHALLERLQHEGRHVLFAGDGLNDVAAMAWSHVSLTISASPLLLREMSSLVLTADDWRRLPEALAIAREARKLVRANLAFALAYNAVGMGLAAAGVLHPVAAALIMLFSSLTVILYSMHLMDKECELK
ncbi:MAG: heavy metal translocating P-type ATPase [Bryobacter sp.]|nr:heavy metal translocating P-type ATPase [Bryobacter sp.]